VSSSRTGPYDVHARDEHDGLETLRATSPDGRPVLLLRAADPGQPGGGAQRDLAIAAQVEHPHLTRVADLFHEPDGRLVVAVADDDLVPLTTWLARRGPLAPGELVTVTVPLIAALARAATAGVLLDRPDVCDAALDARGAPHLWRLRSRGTTTDLGAARASAGEAARRLVELVATCLVEPSPRLLDAVAAAGDLDAVVEAVHDLAAPVALPTVRGEGRVALDDAPDDDVPWSTLAGPPRPAWAAVLPESPLVDAALDWARAQRETPLRARLGGVRPRFWVLGGVVAASVVVALVVSSADGSPRGGQDTAVAGSAPTASVTASSPASATGPPTEPSSGGAGRGSVAGPGSGPWPASAPEGDASVPAGDDDVVTSGEDPLAAAQVLVTARARCLADATPSCLAAVDQPDSPVAVRDARVLDDPGAVAGSVVPTTVDGEVQRLGETVLLDAHGDDDEPASVLVVRTEAGWRLREVVARQ
jgi:hypothetical protein